MKISNKPDEVAYTLANTQENHLRHLLNICKNQTLVLLNIYKNLFSFKTDIYT